MTPTGQAASPPSPIRVLIVEDEVVIRMMLEDVLAELGYEVAGIAGNLDDARRLAISAALDIAVLDVNLNGEPVFDVAELLAARGIPMVFATGYGPRAIPEKHRRWPTLDKPYQEAELKLKLELALGGRRQ